MVVVGFVLVVVMGGLFVFSKREMSHITNLNYRAHSHQMFCMSISKCAKATITLIH